MMQLCEVRDHLACEVFSGEEHLDRTVLYGCASDLMSDVLAFSQTGALLLTGLVTVQTIQTAHIAEIEGIVFVRGKRPDARVVALSRQNGIPLLGTHFSMYEASGILYRHGLASTMECSQSADQLNHA